MLLFQLISISFQFFFQNSSFQTWGVTYLQDKVQLIHQCLWYSLLCLMHENKTLVALWFQILENDDIMFKPRIPHPPLITYLSVFTGNSDFCSIFLQLLGQWRAKHVCVSNREVAHQLSLYITFIIQQILKTTGKILQSTYLNLITLLIIWWWHYLK